jgi:hypothetical protein
MIPDPERETEATRKKALRSALSALGIAFDRQGVAAVHDAIAGHPALLGFVHRDGFMLPQFSLGDRHVVDFLVLGYDPASNSPYLTVTFIAAEDPEADLFSPAGATTSELAGALSKVRDWKAWAAENKAELRRQLTEIVRDSDYPGRVPLTPDDVRLAEATERLVISGFRDRYLVLCGRACKLSVRQRVRMAEMNKDLGNLRIATYDAMVEKLIEEIGSESTWDMIPMAIAPIGHEL